MTSYILPIVLMSSMAMSPYHQALKDFNEQEREEIIEAIKTFEGWSDGTRSWRNHNMGNIRCGSFATRHGATDCDSGGYAIFPDDDTGRDALIYLLFHTKSYRDLTIPEAMERYAPSEDNNHPERYADFIIERLK